MDVCIFDFNKRYAFAKQCHAVHIKVERNLKIGLFSFWTPLQYLGYLTITIIHYFFFYVYCVLDFLALYDTELLGKHYSNSAFSPQKIILLVVLFLKIKSYT